jgi:hypothetical protein
MLLVPTLSLALSGCVSTEFGWTPAETGCVDRGLFEVLEAPTDEYDEALGNTDIRVGRLPDTGNGLAALIQFDRRFGGLGVFQGPPRVLLSVGDFNKRTCTVVLSESDCPEAEAVYRRLASQSLPIEFQFEEPSAISVMHGTTFYLRTADGNGNETSWRYVGSPAHPMETEINRAMAELSRCLAPAHAAYQDKRFR